MVISVKKGLCYYAEKKNLSLVINETIYPSWLKIWLIYIFLEVSVIGDSFGTADDV